MPFLPENRAQDGGQPVAKALMLAGCSQSFRALMMIEHGVSHTELMPDSPRNAFQSALSLCLLPGCLNPQPLGARNPGVERLACLLSRREAGSPSFPQEHNRQVTGLFNLMHCGLPGCPW